jgi:hypothetical protein
LLFLHKSRDRYKWYLYLTCNIYKRDYVSLKSTLGLELSYHLHKSILYYSVLKVVLPVHSNVLKGFAPGYLLIQDGSFRSGGENVWTTTVVTRMLYQPAACRVWLD